MQRENKPKLLILTSSFPRSDEDETCGYVRDFARSLANQFEVRVLTFADAQAEVQSQDSFLLIRSGKLFTYRLTALQASRDLHEVISSGLLTKLFVCVSLLIFFLQALRLSLRSDVICSHWMIPSGLIGAILSRLLKKPHMIIEHSGALHLLRSRRVGKRLTQFITTRADKIVVVSRDLQGKLIELCPEAKDKIEVVSMGVNFYDRNEGRGERLSNATSEHCLPLLFLGRLVEIKGVQVLLRALAGRRDLYLIVAGDGELRNELQRLALEYEVNATFLGDIGRAEKAGLFSSCPAVIIPSLTMPCGRTEGLPVVALEALAAGLPVIASRVGGLSEIIDDGHNGFLFEPGNHRMLAEKIDALLKSEELRQKFSLNARRTARQYNWTTVVGARYAELIKDALRTHGASEGYQTVRNETL